MLNEKIKYKIKSQKTVTKKTKKIEKVVCFEKK